VLHELFSLVLKPGLLLIALSYRLKKGGWKVSSQLCRLFFFSWSVTGQFSPNDGASEIIIGSLQQSGNPETLLYIFFYLIPNLFLCAQLSD